MVETKPKEQLRLANLAFGTVERVVRHKLFMLEQREEASAIASADEKAANTEKLKRGVELCLAAAGQRLFADVTAILDESGRAPARSTARSPNSPSRGRASVPWIAAAMVGPRSSPTTSTTSWARRSTNAVSLGPPGPCMGQRWSAIPAPPQSGTLLTMDRTE
jgi:hypothetical protein